ncbi:phosphoadenosine phosphosulfate reductase [Paenibacillus sp. J31TS4]|uniref:phosphoadenylyl-sulfate reductase n=1 Tax=Paenibacillus sp. J31TS4 TaxID=2807195 RepID=UPI001B09FCD5|nr:phosphoadenylyl-sulfate reductase [Paenibacillus sp. J31TS4]GIP41465.1 phosphoadenosine phosphosulfate reductase [Paenibacillus sp. J31TS4]
MNLLEKEQWIQTAADQLENDSPEAVIRLAVETYPKLTLACSFGAEDVVLVDMLHRISPSTDIFYLDTNLHFPETYETRDKLEARYGRSFLQVLPKLTLAEQAVQHGEELWASNPNQCCGIRKVDPLTDILGKYDAWLTGIRRDQAPTRANARKVEYDVKFGLVKFNPLADWTSERVWHYIRENNLIYNPLHDQNYPSIGCEKCTKPVLAGQDPRAGRWSGFEKTECGLHK